MAILRASYFKGNCMKGQWSRIKAAENIDPEFQTSRLEPTEAERRALW
jgi:hypothetical protein